jgi:hypothetical protein
VRDAIRRFPDGAQCLSNALIGLVAHERDSPFPPELRSCELTLASVFRAPSEMGLLFKLKRVVVRGIIVKKILPNFLLVRLCFVGI